MSFLLKGNEKKVVTSKSTVTSSGHLIHSTSVTSITQYTSAHTKETRTTTTVQKIETSSPFASQTSLNSFTEKISNPSGSNTSLQKFDHKEFTAPAAPLKNPQYNASLSTDAIPFTSSTVYKSSPYRSAFTSTPLTTRTSASPVNLNYQSPYTERVRSRSVTSPNGSPLSNIPLNLSISKPIEPPKKSNTVQRDDEEFRQKLTVKVVKSARFYDDQNRSKVPLYTTRSKYRGKLLLINNIKFVDEKHMRKGAELDEINIKQLFTQMGFEIVKWRDLKKKDMENKIISFRNSDSLRKFDIAAVIVMSHGTGKESSGSTEVVCTDEQLLQTTWIINQFDATLCPHLSGKPKIFIFQCCRGNNTDIVVQHDSVPFAGPRKLSDMLIAYSTIPGFVSHRDPENGTWYIQAICKVFMEHAHDTDVESLLKIVDSKLASLVTVSGSKQTSSFENRGFKTCYLHPQLHQ